MLISIIELFLYSPAMSTYNYVTQKDLKSYMYLSLYVEVTIVLVHIQLLRGLGSIKPNSYSQCHFIITDKKLIHPKYNSDVHTM